MVSILLNHCATSSERIRLPYSHTLTDWLARTLAAMLTNSCIIIINMSNAVIQVCGVWLGDHFDHNNRPGFEIIIITISWPMTTIIILLNLEASPFSLLLWEIWVKSETSLVTGSLTINSRRTFIMMMFMLMIINQDENRISPRVITLIRVTISLALVWPDWSVYDDQKLPLDPSSEFSELPLVSPGMTATSPLLFGLLSGGASGRGTWTSIYIRLLNSHPSYLGRQLQASRLSSESPSSTEWSKGTPTKGIRGHSWSRYQRSEPPIKYKM